MSLLNRTKNYFFLACVLMCGFLSLLTWHMLYGTYSLSFLPGADFHVKHQSRKTNKVRLATKRLLPVTKLQNLAIDKLNGQMVPLFDEINSVKKMISQRNQFNDQSSHNDIKSSNQNASKMRINYVNELKSSNQNSPKMRINYVNDEQKSSNHNASKMVRINYGNDHLKSSNQNAPIIERINNDNEVTNHNTRYQMTYRKVKSQVNSANQIVQKVNTPLEVELRNNKNTLDDAWKMYKERTENLKLTGNNQNEKKKFPKIKNYFTNYKLNPELRNLKSKNLNLRNMKLKNSKLKNRNNIPQNNGTFSLQAHKVNNTWETIQKLTRHMKHQNIDSLNTENIIERRTSSDGIKHNMAHQETYTVVPVNRPERVKHNMAYQETYTVLPVNIPERVKNNMASQETYTVVPVNRPERVKHNMAYQETYTVLPVNRPESVKPFEHSVIDSSRLAQLKKQHPWLILSNFERLGAKTAFRPEDCKNCFTPEFPIIIDRKMKCKTDKLGSTDLLILIFSAPENFEIRDVIRNTWGKVCRDPRESTACLFVIGLSNYGFYNKKIENESALYSDILQIGFKDSYANLTYKTISSLKWVQENCDTTRHVMKTDDDMYVNTELIPLMLKAAPISQFVGGHCWGSSRPNRDSVSKWYVSITSFKREKFPPMCSGTGYVMSIDMVKSILLTSKNIPFFHLEDVYIALCLQKLGVRPINLMGFSNMFQEFESCRYRNEVMTSHQIPPEYLRLYWTDIEQCPQLHVSPNQIYVPLPSNDIE